MPTRRLNATRHARIRRFWVIAAAAAWGAAVLATLGGPDAAARVGPGVHKIIVPGLKYLGNASCAGAKCHTADKATEQSGRLIGDENNIWDSGDPHQHAWDSLDKGYVRKRPDGTTYKTADMLAKLKIDDATASAKCLTCHATNAPADQRGDKFRLQTGVSCEACHGPAEKYNDPHAKAGWTDQKRKEIGAQGLFDQFGLVDTSNLAARANTCVACHLQIDKELVDAGHPPLKYDQYAYNTIIYKYYKYYDANPDNNNDANPDLTHWVDPSGVAFTAKLWATGLAAARDAAKANAQQWGAAAGDGSAAGNLLDYYSAVMAIVSKHFKGDTAEALSHAEFTKDAVVAAAKDVAALAPTAKTPVMRWGVVQGLAALGDIFTNGDQAFWDSYNAAVEAADAGGEAYQAAVKKMAEKVK
jgi:Cytochrome c554 and c-prime